MSRLKLKASFQLCTVLLGLTSSPLSAFEQGTYFIYQLVDKIDTQAVNQRLTVECAFFAETSEVETTTSKLPEKRSEFKIDLNTLGTSKQASFSSVPLEKAAPQATSDSSLFDLRTDETISLFGN